MKSKPWALTDLEFHDLLDFEMTCDDTRLVIGLQPAHGAKVIITGQARSDGRMRVYCHQEFEQKL